MSTVLYEGFQKASDLEKLCQWCISKEYQTLPVIQTQSKGREVKEELCIHYNFCGNPGTKWRRTEELPEPHGKLSSLSKKDKVELPIYLCQEHRKLAKKEQFEVLFV